MVKNGFSLAEALVVMAVISIFFAVATKVITTKPKAQNESLIHGQFECYYEGGTLKQRYVRNDVAQPVENKQNFCEFVPPVGVGLFSINTYTEDADGILHSSFEPNITENLRIQLNNNVTIVTILNSDDSESYSLQQNITIQQARLFFDTVYPNANIGPNRNSGLMISW